MPTDMSLPSFGSATSRDYQPTPSRGTAAMFREYSSYLPCSPMTLMTPPSNTRLKLTAPVVCGRLLFVNSPVRRRSFGAFR